MRETFGELPNSVTFADRAANRLVCSSESPSEYIQEINPDSVLVFPKAFEIRYPSTGYRVFLTVMMGRRLARMERDGKLRTDFVVVKDSQRGRVIRKYQRPKSKSRVNSIKQFLGGASTRSLTPAILPQGIVLSVRRRLRLRARPSTRLVNLPRGLTYHIVDGQHRVAALVALSKTLDFPIPVAVVSGLTEAQEGALFLMMNHTQKKVPAEVRLLHIARLSRGSRSERYDSSSLLRAVGVRGATLEALDLAARQVLSREHFWFDKVSLPEGEEA